MGYEEDKIAIRVGIILVIIEIILLWIM